MIKFRINRHLRFLSHAETLRVFQRVFVRAGITIRYSQGINPRAKLSLPLPRNVGVESEEDLLTVQVHREPELINEPRVTNHDSPLKARLSRQLPDGCELLSVNVVNANISFQPYLATYVLSVKPGEAISQKDRTPLHERLNSRIKCLLKSKTLNIERRIPVAKRRLPGADFKTKIVDVRGFLKSIKLQENPIIDDMPASKSPRQKQGRKKYETPVQILVECKINPEGSIRPEEILKLLELDPEKLAAPIRRTNVRWIAN